MEQVKKDAESNEALKKDWEAVSKKSEAFKQRSAAHEDKLKDASESMKAAAARTQDMLSKMREQIEQATADASAKVNSAKEKASSENETVKKAMDWASSKYEEAPTVMPHVKGAFSSAMDKASSVIGNVAGEEKAASHKVWKAERDMKAASEETLAKMKEEHELKMKLKEKAEAEGWELPPEAPPDNALVVSKSANSSWDRFGAGLQDMPLLSSLFENQLFEKMFGESEIAASIREMKEIDPSFRLTDFQEEIEEVIAPHLVKMYLEGDADVLKMHCGEAAFHAVNASITARRKQKLSLDTDVLAGPNEVELKGAKLMDQGAPYFFWTFQTQQINCLRDAAGDIVEGAVDDIRSVFYLMAVTRHPELEKPEIGTKLEYPWQISEVAVIGNQPCF